MTGPLRKLSVRDLDVRGKRVLLRVDFNVPLDESLHVTDDRRVRSTLPTIRLLLEKGAVVVLASHFGRPKGKVVEDQRLAPMVPAALRAAGYDPFIESLRANMRHAGVLRRKETRAP